jgi:alpha-methylacyl-CoA racemase
MAVGAIEDEFYAQLLELLDLTAAELPDRRDRTNWPGMKELFASVFRTRTKLEWCKAIQNFDACVTPVHSPADAPADPHATRRGSFIERADIIQPAPAPRFERTHLEAGDPPQRVGQHTDDVLAESGFAKVEIDDLRRSGAVA